MRCSLFALTLPPTRIVAPWGSGNGRAGLPHIPPHGVPPGQVRGFLPLLVQFGATAIYTTSRPSLANPAKSTVGDKSPAPPPGGGDWIRMRYWPIHKGAPYNTGLQRVRLPQVVVGGGGGHRRGLDKGAGHRPTTTQPPHSTLSRPQDCCRYILPFH